MTGGGDIPVPTPIVAHGLIFITNAHGKMAPIYAVQPTRAGDITLKDGETSNAHIAWSQAREGAYMQTPLVYGDLLYVCRDNGVLSVYDAQHRASGTTRSGSADGKTGLHRVGRRRRTARIYYTSEEGDVYVDQGGAGVRAAGDESAGRSRDGDAGDLGGTISSGRAIISSQSSERFRRFLGSRFPVTRFRIQVLVLGLLLKRPAFLSAKFAVDTRGIGTLEP